MLESSKKFGMQLGFGKYGSVSETTFKAKFSAVFAKEHPKYFSTPALLFSATAEASNFNFCIQLGSGSTMLI